MEPAQSPRVALLGASNLARGLAHALGEVRARTGGGARVVAALGRGRSFGLESSFAGRSLPAILECGLWRALERPPTHALLCDVGNDLAYGVEPARIAEWVSACLARLDGARIVVTALPLANIRAIAPWKFRMWSALIFPSRRIERSALLARAEALDARLRELARARGAALAELDPAWYGADPIHIALARRRAAWNAILAGWRGAAPDAAPPRPVHLFGPLLVPERRRVLGLEQRGRQPVARFADGTTLALY